MSDDPMDSSPLGSSVHEIFQARILEWVAIFFSQYSFYIYFLIFTYLVALGLSCTWDCRPLLKHVGSNSIIKNQTWASSIGIMES